MTLREFGNAFRNKVAASGNERFKKLVNNTNNANF
jgi:hypothetical protein